MGTAGPIDRFELRRQDYSLSAEQRSLQELVRGFLAEHCDVEVVRRAEPTGFDPRLWERAVDLGMTRMALPDERGGIGADLVDLVILAEEWGRAAAPLPLVEHAVATRLLLTRTGPTAERLAEVLPDAAWDAPLGLDVRAGAADEPLVLGGAVAPAGVVHAGALELWRAPRRCSPVTTDGALPLARWADPEERLVLATGQEAVRLHRQSRGEWKLLTAAVLLGLTQAALDEAVSFARTRSTRGVPIGSLQAVSHPLADVAVALESGRNLVRRAAWMTEHEPSARPDLLPAAFAFAVRTALRGVETAVHVHGGFGFTVEAAVSLHFLRVRRLAVVAGDPGRDVVDVVAARDRMSGAC